MMMIFEISKTHGTKHALSSSNAQNSIYPDHKTILFRRRNEKKTRHWNWGGEIWNLIEFFSINPYFPVKQEEIPAKKNVPILFPLYPSSVLPEQMNATGKKNMGKTKGLVEEEKWNKKEKWLKRNWYYFFCCWRERERERRGGGGRGGGIIIFMGWRKCPWDVTTRAWIGRDKWRSWEGVLGTRGESDTIFHCEMFCAFAIGVAVVQLVSRRDTCREEGWSCLGRHVSVEIQERDRWTRGANVNGALFLFFSFLSSAGAWHL